MTKERIDIVVPDAVLAENSAKSSRLEAVHRFQRPDRVPVLAGEDQYVCLAARKRTFAQYVRSPADNLREQILNNKWQYENIRDDAPVPTESLTFKPDLGCLRATEFPMDIVWQEDGPPKCVHPLQSLADIDRLAIPPPDGALHRKFIDWRQAMRQAAEQLDVRLNGQPLRIDVTLSHGGGPIPAAFALAGANLFLWMMEDPGRVHRLMEIVTVSHIDCIRYFDALVGRSVPHEIWLGCDAAEMISPKMFREFVVPYYQRVWEQFAGPPRVFHMCGRIDHLLTIIRDDLGIARLDGFGSVTARDLLAETMAGRVLLQGGPDIGVALDGSPEALADECRQYIRTVGRHGGFILQPGGGVSLAAITKALPIMLEASVRSAG